MRKAVARRVRRVRGRRDDGQRRKIVGQTILLCGLSTSQYRAAIGEERLKKKLACPTPFFMQFRGQQAHPKQAMAESLQVNGE